MRPLTIELLSTSIYVFLSPNSCGSLQADLTWRRSRTLDPKHLIISPGKAAWAIYIDLVCINYDGNAFDAAVLATMAALRNSQSASLDLLYSSVNTNCRWTCPRDFCLSALTRSYVLIKLAKLPRATFNPDTNRTTCLRSERYPLPLGRMPLSCTFGMFES